MSQKNSRELPEESLASLDEFGNRLFIYPAAVRGLWHKRRVIFQIILLAIFLLLPWLKINGHQALLLDLPRRQFAIFGLTFWAHDGPLLFFVLAGAALTLILVTAVWGRVWCGWACPQTVFIEMVFRRIEIWFEGNHIERRKLNERDLDFDKAWRKSLKWFVFLLVSLIIGNTFLAYFVGMDRVLEMVQLSPRENWTSFLVMSFATGITLFDFGWFREQFCIIMCPYGRFQSVLMDEQSLAVVYDPRRGEPRKGSPEALAAGRSGDCIACMKCVAVCPTAIDIRRGVQMECIACTACIDACDEVMEKIGKPKGLIRYGSEAELKGEKVHWLRPRVIAYSILVAGLGIGLLVALGRREPLNVAVLRAIEAPYQEITLKDGRPGLTNHFRLALKNNDFSPVKVTVNIEDPPLQGEIRIISAEPEFFVGPGQSARPHVFLEFPKELVDSTGHRHLVLTLTVSGEHIRHLHREELELLGPKN